MVYAIILYRHRDVIIKRLTIYYKCRILIIIIILYYYRYGQVERAKYYWFYSLARRKLTFFGLTKMN